MIEILRRPELPRAPSGIEIIPTTEGEEEGDERFPVSVMVVVTGPKEVVLKRQAGQRIDAER